MSVYQIIAVILGVLSIVSSVAWTRLWRKGKRIVKDARLIALQYRAAVADGRITDEEKKKIGETAVEIIESAADIWQALDNLVRELARVVRGEAKK